MKKIVLIFLILISYKVQSQIVYISNYQSSNTLNVMRVESEFEADLIVYVVDYPNQATRDGRWYFTEVHSDTTNKIYFVNYSSQAQLKVYFTNNIYKAKWRNLAKKKLINWK